nr:hypothetical protein [Escherichia coli]
MANVEGDTAIQWARQSHPVLEAFISLLSLPDSRFVSELALIHI